MSHGEVTISGGNIQSTIRGRKAKNAKLRREEEAWAARSGPVTSKNVNDQAPRTKDAGSPEP